MTRIPVHSVDSAPEGSRDALEAPEAQFGEVLDIHGAMAHSPAVLETHVAVQRVLEDTGTLDERLREVVALAVADVDDCSYCQAAHTAGGRAAGLSEQETMDVRRGQVDDPRTAAPVTLVDEFSATTADVSLSSAPVHDRSVPGRDVARHVQRRGGAVVREELAPGRCRYWSSTVTVTTG